MPFKKGQSGNPSGRKPKSDTERRLQLEARALTTRSLKTLERNLDCGNPAAEVSAAKEILDRGWGKATQIVHATVEHTVTTGDAHALASRLRSTADPAQHTVQ